ncbi:hypothetical protein [Rhodoglobus vestalii]|nr:hypothetical protein [Rhodoglobus vestalii]
MVPGTIAAYQAEGTRGFVLTLSAAVDAPYAIDPRMPLFQYLNSELKKSHISLARVLGILDAVEAQGFMTREAWSKDRVSSVAKAWVEFNTNYTNVGSKAFEKYARRLKRELPQDDAKSPTWILAPYLMLANDDLETFRINQELWDQACAHADEAGVRARMVRVIATDQPETLVSTSKKIDETDLIIWIDDLDEVSPTNVDRLGSYARAVRTVAESGKRLFALYGGYFAVTLGSVGLKGASHGIGFSEHRNHVELRSSGGAPARYYVQRLHRYLPVDLASELWRRDSSLVESYYPGYLSRDPAELEYHELMKLSVNARQDEIFRSQALTPSDHVADLRATFASYREDLSRVRLTEGLRSRISSNMAHLLAWASALDSASP